MPTPDTRSARLLLTTEARLEAAVITVMSEWVQATREAILHEAAQSFGLTAAGYPDPTRSVDAAAAAYRVWRQGVNNTLIPQVGIAFGEAYNQSRHSADFSPYRFEQEYLATVSDRLVIWPEGAFEDIRPEIMEALSEGEDFDQIRDRVGRVLGIGARTRAIQARINEIDIELTDPMLDAASERALRAARAELWREHDDSLGEWQWKARRIARTEAQGAVNGGKLSAARAAEIATGQHYHKRWRSTPDRRVRLSHHVADGQVVALSERFRVGGVLLDHPGDPSGIAPHETINCRCVIAVLTPDLLQRELQGPNGSMGEIRPGGIRMGPDDPDDADQVIAALAKETGRPAPSIGQRGEDHGQTSPAPAPIDIPTPTDRRDPDLTGLSDDELLAVMAQALDDRDMAVFEAADREFDRRDQNDSTPDDHEEDDDVPRPQEPVHQLPTPPQDTGTFDAFTDPDDDRTIPLDTIGPEPDWAPAPDRQPQRLDADTIQQLIDLGFSAVPTDTDGQVLVNDQPFTLIHTPRIGDIPAPPGGRIIVDVPSGDPRSLLAELLAALGHALIEAVVIVAGRISAWRRPPP